MPEREIYLLSPRALSPETIAVAFAKTSRSPESFREIAAELSDESSAKFHEKWVVGYGHASVAEHAVLHIAFENVSRVAIETIEGNRLASYTEKSTRYQKWGMDDFTIPPELDGHPLRDEFVNAIRLLFSTYAESLDPVKNLIVERSPRRENESAEAYDRRIRSQYVDRCRFLLPAAANANVGMTANARVIEMTIRKMLSHPLAEVQQIGEKMKEVAKAEAPTLVKYAEANEYAMKAGQEIGNWGLENRDWGLENRDWRLENRDWRLENRDWRLENRGWRLGNGASDWCSLIDYDREGEDKILAAAIYRFDEIPYANALAYVKSLKENEKEGLAATLLGKLGRYDVPLRELEYSTYTFDLVMDQGAYAEFKRHRMMTQTPQRLTTRLGWTTPLLITEAGFGSRYEAAMETASNVYEKLHAFNPDVAQYIVPNGFNRRALAQFNLREAFAFCQLRSAANAHFSIRRVAQKIYEDISRVHPLLTKYMKLREETWQSVEENYFTRV
ncbi:MAG: FAD-dependent thymidylate synthase [Chloroflexi bacterium CFX1]|nr:FAD-dependent thymidylate synthase [Chloroflexi bacterium CFX1]MDL1918581.1 FAD-dependent thymidylate synthase [Chloroflexi bacterium CFX5]NUQ58128.1 FAD-dependent thymidylate synthase [Anaerolineales bacterium]